MQINFKINGLNQAITYYTKLEGNLRFAEQKIQIAVSKLAKSIWKNLQIQVPVDTGDLKRSLRVIKSGSGADYELQIQSDRVYAAWVAHGHGGGKTVYASDYGHRAFAVIMRASFTTKAQKANPYDLRAYDRSDHGKIVEELGKQLFKI